MDSHIELVEDYRAEVEAEKKKAENFESDLLAIDLERNRLKVENDKLKQSATTPRPPPPVPGSVQAIIDANHDDVNKLCATIIANQRSASAADPGTSRVNPAARYIECNNLEDPAHVTLHDYMSWRHSFELYSIANNIDKEPYSSRKAFVTQKLHIHWRPLIQNGDITWHDTQSLEDMLNAISKYIKDRRHPLLDRRDFLNRTQRSTETHEMFLQHLEELYNCSRYKEELTFPLSEQTFKRMLKRDLFLRGITNNELRKEILKHPLSDLTLEKVKTLAMQLEQATSTSDNLQARKIQAIKFKSQYKRNQKSNAIQRRNATGPLGKAPPSTSQPPTVPSRTGPGPPRPNGKASRQPPKVSFHRACMQTHAFGSGCHAAKLPCEACGTLGHVPGSNYCSKQRPVNSKQNKKSNIRTLRVLEHTDLTSTDCIAVEVAHRRRNKTHKSTWGFLPDTGADVTTANIHDVTDSFGIDPSTLIPVPAVKVFGGKDIPAMGTMPITLAYKGRTIETSCFVFKGRDKPILGKQQLKELGILPEGWPHHDTHAIVQRDHQHDTVSFIKDQGQSTTKARQGPMLWDPRELYRDYPTVFTADEKFRQMKGRPVRITLMDGAIPFKLYKPYTTPLHYEERLRKKLDDMLAKGIIERVPSDEIPVWTAGLVVADKKDSNDIRVTVDLSKLNKYVNRPGFAITVPGDKVKAIPSGMRYFSVFDAKHGYWQVPIDEQSRHLTTFITTTHNLLRYKVLPMGLNLSAAEYGKRVEEALRGLPNTTSVVEDILVFSKTLASHKVHVRQLMERCKKHGIQLNKAKSYLAQEEIDYCGYRLNSTGFTVSPRLSNALADFPRPENKTDLRSLVGMINVFRDFDEAIGTLLRPLTDLQSPKVDFKWTSAQENAFIELRKRLVSPRVLAHFIPDQPLRLECDGSRVGLGFILFQEDRTGKYRVIQAGSRHITPTESRYSVTELELLAACWSLEKARYFCAGAPRLELVTDHRPLVSIINTKTLGDLTTPRIQRLRERLYRYPALMVTYREGKKQVVADALSRRPVDIVSDFDILVEDDVERHVNMCISTTIRELTVNVRAISSDATDDDTDITRSTDSSDLLLSQLKTACQSDSTYRKLHELTETEFPAQKSQLDDDLKPYWTCRDDLSTEGPLVLYKHRTIIPQEMRKAVLERLHASHSGITKTLLRVQGSVFWPKINHQVSDMIKRCPQCQRFRSSNPPEPPLHNVDFENQETAGRFLSLDFFHHDQKEWLVISCNFSGYFHIYKMGHSATANDLIHSIRDWISNFGRPIRIRSDGGPQMDSAAYREFCEQNYIRPSFSSPHVHCSTAEVAVKAAKNILRKTRYKSAEYFNALLEYRSSPRSTTLQSPNSLVYKSLPLTLVPALYEEQQDATATDANARRREAQSRADSYTRHKDDLSPLTIGQPVLAQNTVTKLWDRTGVIVRRERRRRSYEVQMDDGGRLWRNRKLLQPQTSDSPRPDPDDDPPAAEAYPAPTPRRSKRTRRPPNRL